jgi:DNA-binding MarR family transcriptional regulator
MGDKFKENIDSMAKEIREQARNIRVDTFLSYIYTSDILNRYLDLLLPDRKVSRAGFNVLHHLILNDGSMIPTDISRKTFRSKYSVTRVIDTLERQGLVKRRPAGKDRRTRRIDITRKGLRAVADASIDSRERISQNVFRILEDQHLVEFNDTLKQVRRHVLGLIDAINESKKNAAGK